MPQVSDYRLTTRQVAAQLGVNLDTVARWADKKGLVCLRTPGGFRRFRQEDVDAFAATLLPSSDEEAS